MTAACAEPLAPPVRDRTRADEIVVSRACTVGVASNLRTKQQENPFLSLPNAAPRRHDNFGFRVSTNEHICRFCARSHFSASFLVTCRDERSATAASESSDDLRARHAWHTGCPAWVSCLASRLVRSIARRAPFSQASRAPSQSPASFLAASLARKSRPRKSHPRLPRTPPLPRRALRRASRHQPRRPRRNPLRRGPRRPRRPTLPRRRPRRIRCRFSYGLPPHRR